MVKYKFIYNTGETVIKEFENDNEALWYAHNEGDHLIVYYKL